MTVSVVLHILLYFGVILALTKPLGAYMHAVFEGESAISRRLFTPIERVIYRVFFVDETTEMDWKRYTISMLLFSAASMFVVYTILRSQGHLPLNPQDMPGTTPHLA